MLSLTIKIALYSQPTLLKLKIYTKKHMNPVSTSYFAQVENVYIEMHEL